MKSIKLLALGGCVLAVMSTTACTKKAAPAPAETTQEASQTTEPVKNSVEDEVKAPSVIDIQKALNKHGAHLKTDGKMGPSTKAAIKKFQAKNKIKATGIADAATLSKLGAE
ncbi:MAG: peptidoglycan-binding protein [Proteobacteria bacterium]|nr:peptidoglycan-binding protein [Pseudomonadota bacterium]